MSEQEKKKVGFAKLDPEDLKKVSSKGGKGAHAKGSAHKFTTETAKEAAKRSRSGHKFTAETGKEAAAKAAVARKSKEKKA